MKQSAQTSRFRDKLRVGTTRSSRLSFIGSHAPAHSAVFVVPLCSFVVFHCWQRRAVGRETANDAANCRFIGAARPRPKRDDTRSPPVEAGSAEAIFPNFGRCMSLRRWLRASLATLIKMRAEPCIQSDWHALSQLPSRGTSLYMAATALGCRSPGLKTQFFQRDGAWRATY